MDRENLNVKLNIAICDDNFASCNEVRSILMLNFSELINSIEEFANGSEMLDYINKSRMFFNFIFLDLEMPEMDGITLAEKLRSTPFHSNSVIIIVSGYDAPVVPIVSIHPYAYLKKPVDPLKLCHTFKSALSIYIENESTIVIGTKSVLYNFPVKDIMYVQSCKRKILLCPVSGEKTLIGIAFKNIASGLIDDYTQFVQVHKSYIVNLGYIKYIHASSLTMTNGDIIPVSRTYRKDFLAALHKSSRFLA